MKILRGAFKVNSVKKRLSIAVVFVVAFFALGLTPAQAVDERIVDVVQVVWAGAKKPATTAAEVLSLIDSDVNARWKSYTTLVGDTKDRVISFVSGKTVPDPISITGRMPCNGSAASDFMSQTQRKAYAQLGISDYSKRYLVIISPNAGCVWSGRAGLGNKESTNGVLVLHDSASAFVIAHELGHTFGLGHSNFLRCDSGAKDGAWGNDCKAVEYGGVIDAMGNLDTASQLNTYHQWRMGYLDDSQIKQVWGSESVTLSPSDFAAGTKAIFIRDGNSAYWIEYRRANPATSYKAGLVVFRLDPPPITAVVSPNPEDATAEDFSQEIGTDVWMLNLDSYKYVLSRSSGSMTSTNAATYSGNIAISATTSDKDAVVTITRKADITPPPTPILLDPKEWKYPAFGIIKNGFEDAESAVTGFQISVDGLVSDLAGSTVTGWVPTYLSPFTAPITVLVRDLPEGSYALALRSIDQAGNKSLWSDPVNATIDRGHPNLSNDFSLTAANSRELSLTWVGAADKGSGLCSTQIINQYGFVTQSSVSKSAPKITITNGQEINSTANVFDCVGNGVAGDFAATATFTGAEKSSRIGKWVAAETVYGTNALKCIGKCSASLTVKGDVSVLVGTGASTLTVASKVIATIPDSKVAKLRVGALVKIGPTKKVMRISGSNFVLIGAANYSVSFTNPTQIDRIEPVSDSSLEDPIQSALSRYGFNTNDFSQDWIVLPMNNGTTLLDPSLDLCGGTYLSEKDRAERRQTIALKKSSPYSFLSTEVVRYSSTAAAELAQKELQNALAKCAKEKGFTDTAGTFIPYSFSALKNLPLGLATDSQRSLVRAQINTGEKAQQLLGFYQFNGALLTGLYVIKAGEIAFTDAEVSAWLKVAETMAARLKS